MDLLDVIDPNFGLVKDKNTGRKFGDKQQLSIIGWSGRNGPNKRFILFCDECSRDYELFGEGYFTSSISNLINRKLPCGCSRSSQKTKHQYTVIARRVCEELGLKFLGFVDELNDTLVKCVIECPKHGVYETTSLNSLINQLSGCRKCAQVNQALNMLKSDGEWVTKFLSTGMFSKDTKFSRSEVTDKGGYKTLWSFSCPTCGWEGLSNQSNLAAGKIPCKCSYISKMSEAYINLISDGDIDIALKFGISSSSKRRIKGQDRVSVYTFTQLGVWKFPDHYDCRRAETFLKNDLKCQVLSKEELPDGYTETTYIYNLEKIMETYEKFGGIRID